MFGPDNSFKLRKCECESKEIKERRKEKQDIIRELQESEMDKTRHVLKGGSAKEGEQGREMEIEKM